MTTESIIALLVSSVVGLLLWFFKSQNDRRYHEFEAVKKMSLENKELLALNKQSDKTDAKAFETYKKDMKEKNDKFDRMLDKIVDGISELNGKVSALAIDVGILKERK